MSCALENPDSIFGVSTSLGSSRLHVKHFRFLNGLVWNYYQLLCCCDCLFVLRAPLTWYLSKNLICIRHKMETSKYFYFRFLKWLLVDVFWGAATLQWSPLAFPTPLSCHLFEHSLCIKCRSWDKQDSTLAFKKFGRKNQLAAQNCWNEMASSGYLVELLNSDSDVTIVMFPLSFNSKSVVLIGCFDFLRPMSFGVPLICISCVLSILLASALCRWYLTWPNSTWR